MNLLKKMIAFLNTPIRIEWGERKIEYRDAEISVPLYNKDPNGLLPRDVLRIRKWLPSRNYQKGDSLEEIAYKEAQHKLLDTILERLTKPRPLGDY